MGRPRGLLLFALGYALLLELMLIAAVLYWPDFLANVDSIRKLASPIPILGETVGQIEQAGVFGYVAGQHFFKGCNTLGTAAAVLFAAGAIAGEAQRGTLEILLARPYSRARILLERYALGFAAFALPILATSATISALAASVGEDVRLSSALLGAVHQTVFLAPIYGLAFLLSTLGSNPTRIALAVLFGTTCSFGLYMVKRITRWSLFRLCDIDDFVRIDREGALDPRVLGPLLAAALALYVGSQIAFRRRVP
jgi:ABC-2 type transport system permease protein